MKRVYIVIPTYYDGKALLEIVKEISYIFKERFKEFIPSYILIDDSSGRDKSINRLSKQLSEIKHITLIKTRSNLGNQGAIIIGLKTIINKINPKDYIVVLDADGEDDPQDIINLLKTLEENQEMDIILAERGKRASGFRFKFSLTIFKFIFKILTGKKWKSGNFSILSGRWIIQNFHLIVLFNSYAGSIQSIPARRIFITIDRKARRYGSSQTSSKGKIIHALNSLTPWVETIQVRALLFFGFMFKNFIFSLILISVMKFVYHTAAPNWFTIVIFSTISLSLISLNIFLTSQMMISIMSLAKRFDSEFLYFAKK